MNTHCNSFESKGIYWEFQQCISNVLDYSRKRKDSLRHGAISETIQPVSFLKELRRSDKRKRGA